MRLPRPAGVDPQSARIALGRRLANAFRDRGNHSGTRDHGGPDSSVVQVVGGRPRQAVRAHQREAPAAASPSARASSTTATAGSGAWRASLARTSWPSLAARPRSRLRWRRPEATVRAGCARRGRRPAPPEPAGRRTPAARACWEWPAACRRRARRPPPPSRAVWSTAAGTSGAGRGLSAPPRSPRRAGCAGRTRLRGARCPRPHPRKLVGSREPADRTGRCADAPGPSSEPLLRSRRRPRR